MTSSKSKSTFGFRFSSIDGEEKPTESVHSTNWKLRDDSDNSYKYVTTGSNWLRPEAPARFRSNSDFGVVPVDVQETIDFDPSIIRDCLELQQRLDMMHERCIARNLRTAGLGGLSDESEIINKILDPNARMITGETMLTAIIFNVSDHELQTRYASILLSEGADVNAKDDQGKTALMYACGGGHERIIKVLLQHDETDLLLRDNEGNTALMYAASFGSLKILKLYLKTLRKYDKIPSHQKQCPKDESSGTTVTEMTALVRERSRSIPMEDPLDTQNSQGNTARALALKNGHLECANLLNEERLRRMKEKNKRLNSLTTTNRSPLRRSAKKLSQKFMLHSSSFDSIYVQQEGKTDKDFVDGKSSPVKNRTMRRSQPETSNVHFMITDDKRESGCERKISANRIQSNPDLAHLRSNGSYEIVEDDVIDEDHSANLGEVMTRGEGSDAKQILQQQPRQYGTYGSIPATEPSVTSKWNLAEKVMNLLRRRPVSVSSRTCQPFVFSINRRSRSRFTSAPKQRSTSSAGFSNEEKIVEKRSSIEESSRESQRVRKNRNSQPDLYSNPLLVRHSNQTPTTSKSAKEILATKRRSIDFHRLPPFRTQTMIEKEIDRYSAEEITIAPLSVQRRLGIETRENSKISDRRRMSTSILPPLHQHSDASKLRISHLVNEDASADSGLASSARSSATGNSERPISADSKISAISVVDAGLRKNSSGS